MNPCELTLSVTVVANGIAAQMTDDELEMAAAIFTQLGDTLATILLARDRCQGTSD
jgi:hypothetical protein